jgi:spermidine synthase
MWYDATTWLSCLMALSSRTQRMTLAVEKRTKDKMLVSRMATALPFVFFLSGAAGLIFETLWFRLAGLSLGNSVWASSVVLAAFMGGIGLGNLVAAVRGRFVRQPLRLYAALEVVVGVFGLGVVLALPHVTWLVRPLMRSLGETLWLVQGVRLSVAFLLMLVPAAAMGVTLPLLTRALSDVDSNFGRVLGGLYGWNTLGGVVGAVAGEILLIRLLGLRGSALVAASLDIVAALLALAIAARTAESARSGSEQPERPPEQLPVRRAGRVLAAAAISGCLVLALEVVWFRFLLLYVTGTSLAFAVMLAVILMGIGLGGLAAARWFARYPDAIGWLPCVALLSGAVTAFCYAAFDPRVGGATVRMDNLRSVFWLSARLMLPTAFLSGAIFTFLGRALRQLQVGATTTAGRLTLANTVGAMCGALAGGFLLLPTLGVERSLFVLAGAYALVAALVWRRPEGRPQFLALAGTGVVFVLVMGLFPFGLMQNHFLRMALAGYGCPGASATVNIHYREGVNETISVLRYYWGKEPFAHRLVTNGHSMAADSFYARRYMKLYAYWAAAVNPDATRALLISYGLGTTASALRDIPGLKGVDVVDTSRDVLDVGETLYRPAANPLHDPRFRVHVEDGRFFLQTTREKFDIITAEPPPPKMAGIVNLYSREFFALARERLNDRGIVTYWLPIHQLTHSDARSIARGFCDVFPNCSLWRGCGNDWMLAGSNGSPRPVSEETFGRIWGDGASAAGLRDIAVEDPAQLGALFIADAGALSAWVGDARPLVDDRPSRLSAEVPTQADLDAMWSIAEGSRPSVAFSESPFVRAVWPEGLRRRTSEHFLDAQALDDVVRGRRGAVLFSRLHRVLTETDQRVMPLALLDSELRYQDIARRAVARGEKAPQLSWQRAIGALSERRYAEAAGLFAAARSGDPSITMAGLLEAFALGLADRKGEGLVVLRSLPKAESDEAGNGGLVWLERYLGEGEPARAPVL